MCQIDSAQENADASYQIEQKQFVVNIHTHVHSSEEILLSKSIFETYIGDEGECLVELSVQVAPDAVGANSHNSADSLERITIVVGPRQVVSQRTEISLFKDLCDVHQDLLRENVQIKIKKIIDIATILRVQ